MYGTVARIRLKPGVKDQFFNQLREWESIPIPGFVGEYWFQADKDPNEYYLTVLFENKDLYFASANNPEQDARFRKMLQFMEGEPEWHDGHIAYSFQAGRRVQMR